MRGRRQVAGAGLALVSGALFTANNFVISQLGVILSSLLLLLLTSSLQRDTQFPSIADTAAAKLVLATCLEYGALVGHMTRAMICHMIRILRCDWPGLRPRPAAGEDPHAAAHLLQLLPLQVTTYTCSCTLL